MTLNKIMHNTHRILKQMNEKFIVLTTRFNMDNDINDRRIDYFNC